MRDAVTFETRLADALGRYADLAPVMDDAEIARQAVAARGRRHWVGPITWPSPQRTLAWSLLTVLALAALGAAIVVGALLLTRHEHLPGAFTSVGPMRYEYASHPGASAVLEDGRVLFVGGATDEDPSIGKPAPGGELFDSRTKTFQPTVGQMSEPRYDPSATTLRDGRVLISGGQLLDIDGKGTPVATGELFDPQTGMFSRSGRMSIARDRHTATLLASGQVLVVGGETLTAGNMVELASAEVFDPGSGSWSDVASMPTPGGGTATLLADGRVLLTGGSVEPVATAEVFDPSTRAFTPASPMATIRFGHTATRLADGRVLVVGGSNGTQMLSSAELYNPSTGRFAATGSLVTERADHTATLLPDGRVLVDGGFNRSGSPHSAEIYDPKTGTFQLAASSLHDHSTRAVGLSDGRVLLAGSQPEVLDLTATTAIAEIPSRSDRTFIPTGDPIEDRFGHTATRLADGRVLIVGGQEVGGELLASAEIFDPKTGSFTATGSISVAPPETVHLGSVPGHTILLLADGRVLMLGEAAYSWELEFYDPVTGVFTDTGSLGSTGWTVREPITAVQLPAGRIIAFGPPLDGPDDPSTTTRAYAIDPAQRRAMKIADLPRCERVDGAVALRDGRVVILCVTGGSVEWVRLFDPASGQTVDLAVPMQGGPVSMTRLDDGRVLFASGTASTVLSLFDPDTGQVAEEATPLEPGGTYLHSPAPTLTVLTDGRVLLVRGPTAAIWDPGTGIATSVPGPTAARFNHTATLLDDRRVLVVGGIQKPPDRGDPQPPGAELFDPAALP
jgi:hypothetical protein